MTDHELIDLLKQNAEAGLREVMELYGRAFHTICKNILRDCTREDIEEAVSDVLAAVWKSREHFDESRDVSFKSFCYGIARKTALKKRRDCLKTGEIIPLNEDLLEAACGLEEEVERKEEEKILREVLLASEEPLCRIFILRYFYFFKVKEIAALLKLSNKQVENYLYRGKEILKRELLKRGWK